MLKLAVDLQFRKSLVETNTVKIGLHKAKAAWHGRPNARIPCSTRDHRHVTLINVMTVMEGYDNSNIIAILR